MAHAKASVKDDTSANPTFLLNLQFNEEEAAAFSQTIATTYRLVTAADPAQKDSVMGKVFAEILRAIDANASGADE